MSVLTLENFSYTYKDGNKALKNINLSFSLNETVAILGNNGSGKTTLLKALANLLEIKEGKIVSFSLENNLEENEKIIRSKIGIVFQNPETQFVSTEVYEDIEFGPRNLELSEEEIEKRTKGSINKMHLKGKEKENPFNLSGGEKERVALAGILSQRPEIILLDEPLTMNDEKGKEEFKSAIKSLKENKDYLLVYSTHYVEDAILSDRVIILKEGSVVADGKVREILENESLLRSSSLIPPYPLILSKKLREIGIKFKTNPLTPSEFAEALCE